MREEELIDALRRLPGARPPEPTMLLERAIGDRGRAPVHARGERALVLAWLVLVPALASLRSLIPNQEPSERLTEISETLSRSLAEGLTSPPRGLWR